MKAKKAKSANPPVRRVTLWRGVTATAKRLGVSHGHLRRVLNGERKPGAALARALKRLGISPLAWWGGEVKGESICGNNQKNNQKGNNDDPR